MIILYVSLLFLILLFSWKNKSENKNAEIARKVPIPDKYPIIGNVHLLVGVSILVQVWKAVKKYSTPIIFCIGPHQIIVIEKPEDIQKCILFHKIEAYETMPFNTGLLSQRDHSIWKPQRNFLQPLFKNTELDTMIPIFNQYARIAVKALEEHVGAGEFNVKRIMGGNVMRQSMATLFGTDLELDEALVIYDELVSILEKGARNAQLYHFLKPCMRHFGLAKFMSRKSKLIIKFSNRMLAERKLKAIQKTEQERPLFLDRVLEMKDNASIKHVNVVDHLAQMLGAAVDTSAVTISNIVLMLAMHPEIQEKCYAEIKTLADGTDDDFDPRSTLHQMPYLTMVIKETMRVIPTIPYIAKLATRDVKLENYDIPAGSEVAISFFTLYRNKEIWGDDAEEFNPDHFLPEVEAKRHKYAYLPFSFGATQLTIILL